MGIVLARIDNRFIHGQILEGWLPFTKARTIIVVGEAAAKNPVQRMAMEAAVPSGIGVKVMKAEDAALAYSRGDLDSPTIILFGNSDEALSAIKKGIKVEELNVGNINFCPGRFQVSPSVSLDKKDLDNFEELGRMGVRVVIRCFPSDPPRDIWEVVNRRED